jgi:hypothetical protein
MSLKIYLDNPELGDSKKFNESNIALNQALTSINLPEYEYNYDLAMNLLVDPTIYCKGFDLQFLRYIAAEFLEEPEWSPGSRFEEFLLTRRIPNFLLDDGARLKSHLIHHYASCGCYVPLDFGMKEVPLNFLLEIGSSIALKNELENLALKLNLNLESNIMNADELEEKRINSLDSVFWRAELMLLKMHNLATASIECNLIILLNG